MTMRQILYLLILSGSLVGCATSPFARLSHPPSQPKKVASWSQTEDIKPIYIGKDQAGKDVIVSEVHRTYAAGSEEITPPLSFMQRIGRWIGGLTFGAIIFIVIALVFFGGAPILWAVKKYYTVKNSLKKVVAGVDELADKDKEAQEQLKDNLSMKMDESEKKLITKLKTEI